MKKIAGVNEYKLSTEREREREGERESTKVQELREKFSLSETFFSQNEIRIKKNRIYNREEKSKKKEVESIIIIMCIYFTLK